MSAGPQSGAPFGALTTKNSNGNSQPGAPGIVVTYYQTIGLGAVRGMFGVELQRNGMQINNLKHIVSAQPGIGWPTRPVISQTNGEVKRTPKPGAKSKPPTLTATRNIIDKIWQTTPVIEFAAEEDRGRWDRAVLGALDTYFAEAHQ